ncbi:XdhC family protein [Falsirhodobacter sp. alg1]|uniref:XdhC family protein n=1 Tax=Falsirhodobacter sp. alg1 TaxID=1472418 RepID=UPI00078918B3|nr:XdhC family protein [Falsirhodobacter sp. alg1]
MNTRFTAGVVTVAQDDFPIVALAKGGAALAVIVGIEGTSYRPLGAAMAVEADGRRTGSLSSGCIDGDVAVHALAAMAENTVQVLRYGAGSPFPDLQLPCGGGLDIAIIPAPDMASLHKVADILKQREPADFILPDAAGGLALRIVPELRFLVFGKGPEAATFANLADAAGYSVNLFSPDADMDVPSRLTPRGLKRAAWPEGVPIDDRTAVLLFFHDHEWEPAILAHALSSPAFYIGAQGSYAARENRRIALMEIGLSQQQLVRLADPFGMIPSARDPRTLAVSVLADVLSKAREA